MGFPPATYLRNKIVIRMRGEKKSQVGTYWGKFSKKGLSLPLVSKIRMCAFFIFCSVGDCYLFPVLVSRFSSDNRRQVRGHFSKRATGRNEEVVCSAKHHKKKKKFGMDINFKFIVPLKCIQYITLFFKTQELNNKKSVIPLSLHWNYLVTKFTTAANVSPNEHQNHWFLRRYRRFVGATQPVSPWIRLVQLYYFIL